MSKIAKSLAVLLVTLALAAVAPMAAFAADSAVTFQSGRVIAFAPGSAYSATDLFDNFKGVMPGDVLTQDIAVQNSCTDFDYIEVYLRAVPHDAANPLVAADVPPAAANDFLSQLHMTVSNGGTLIYDGSPDQPDGLASDVLLGTLRQGESLSLTAELEVPLTLGNDYANQIGEVDWLVTVQGCDDPVPPEEDLIQTGQLNWPIPVLATLGGLCILAGLLLAAKRRKEDRA